MKWIEYWYQPTQTDFFGAELGKKAELHRNPFGGAIILVHLPVLRSGSDVPAAL